MKYAALVKAIRSATAQSQGRAAMAVNQALVLRNCRLFFLSYPGISQTVSGKLELPPELALTSQTVSGKLGDAITSPSANQSSPQIRQTVSAESPAPLAPETLLRLSWSPLHSCTGGARIAAL